MVVDSLAKEKDTISLDLEQLQDKYDQLLGKYRSLKDSSVCPADE